MPCSISLSPDRNAQGFIYIYFLLVLPVITLKIPYKAAYSTPATGQITQEVFQLLFGRLTDRYNAVARHQ